MFHSIAYVQDTTGRAKTALALTFGDPTAVTAPLLRVHAQCFTGEMLGSLRCDCGGQLAAAMKSIAEEGCGVLIYEYEEGRGIGLTAKMQAYELQDYGLDTIEANHALGLGTDYRDYGLPVAILRDLGIECVRLLSNNPEKSRALSKAGIAIVDRLPCEAPPNVHSLAYLRTKKERLGHTLSLADRRFATIDEAIGALREGRMVVVVDDEDRENEGDLVMAAETITPEAVNFMATHGRGLVCLAMTAERLDALQLAPMAPDSDALGGTAFTMSIDARSEGMTTGISVHDRARTIRTAVDPDSGPEDFARPGHVFPLRACRSGVLERRGHTEAAVDLARLAGFAPAGVICEVMNDDGTMARVPDLVRFCTKHGLIMITIADLVRHRIVNDHQESMDVDNRRFQARQREWAA